MRARASLLTIVVLSLASVGTAVAAPGDFDTTFGGDGVVHTNLSSDVPVTDEAFGVAVQDDGKIVAVGAVGGGGGRFAAVRYMPGGGLDGTFGGDGKVFTDITTGEDGALDVALQADGKIVAVGRADVGGGSFAIVRYRPGGRLDTTFGGDGVVVTDVTPGNDAVRAIAIQGDGRIVVAGRAADAFVVARYRPGGALDRSFAGDGLRQTDFTARQDIASAIAIQDDGRIVVAGTGGIRSSGSNSQFAVAAFTEEGSLDVTFSDDGKTLFNLSSEGDFGAAVAIQPTGEIVVAGTSFLGSTVDPDSRLSVVRFLSDGSLDSSFSDDAVRWVNPTSRPDLGHAVAIQPSGRILVAGTSMSINTCCASRAVVVALTSDGDPDDTFHGDTVVTDSNVAQGANDMVLDGAGRTVVAGRAGVDASTFALFRLLGA
jgi:uncharacterized delta-60 repeat protein